MSSEKPLILVVDDEAAICRLLQIQLVQLGYDVITTTDGMESLELYDRHNPSLVVLDLMMPTMSGWDVLRELRLRSEVPVLILTALSSDADQVQGFENGADDYVVKPFTGRQIGARIRAILRRAGFRNDRAICGPIAVDFTAHEVKVHGKEVPLTMREFSLLEAMIKSPGRAFSRAELLARCWEPNFNGVDRVVDVHMASLRRKLGRKQRLITTVRGIGYRLIPEA
jgi:DNA-binding response OmpR family regulator